MYKVAYLLPALAGIARAHISPYHPSMYGVGEYFSSDEAGDAFVPLGPDWDKDEWWFRGPTARSLAPADRTYPSGVLDLPAGGSVMLELACHVAWTSYGWATTEPGSEYDACPGNPGAYHASYAADDVEEDMLSGCALAIADVDDINDVTMDNLVIFSVQQECVKQKETYFNVPAKMPACTGSKCICGWFWLANSGTTNFYMTAMDCSVSGSPADALPIAAPADPVSCADGKGCTKGAKRPIYAYNTPVNVPWYGNENRAGYHDSWSFTNGAQDDIFVTANISSSVKSSSAVAGSTSSSVVSSGKVSSTADSSAISQPSSIRSSSVQSSPCIVSASASASVKSSIALSSGSAVSSKASSAAASSVASSSGAGSIASSSVGSSSASASSAALRAAAASSASSATTVLSAASISGASSSATSSSSTVSSQLTSTAPSSSAVASAAPAVNLARRAKATASSSYSVSPAPGAIDGIVGGLHDGGKTGNPRQEWVAYHQTGRGAWFQLDWSDDVTLNQIVIYDRINSVDNIQSGTIQFSDGSTVPLGPLENTGTEPAYLNLTEPITTTSLRVIITGVSSSTTNVGIAELEAYYVDSDLLDNTVTPTSKGAHLRARHARDFVSFRDEQAKARPTSPVPGKAPETVTVVDAADDFAFAAMEAPMGLTADSMFDGDMQSFENMQ
ncbi:hypothetical protein JCM11641_007368 [Rhodosporidiobolus odoratus]